MTKLQDFKRINQFRLEAFGYYKALYEHELCSMFDDMTDNERQQLRF